MFQVIIILSWAHKTKPLADHSSPDYLSNFISFEFLPWLHMCQTPKAEQVAFPHILSLPTLSCLWWLYSTSPDFINWPNSKPSFRTQLMPTESLSGARHFNFVDIFTFQLLVTLECFQTTTTNSLILQIPTGYPTIKFCSNTNYLESASGPTS